MAKKTHNVVNGIKVVEIETVKLDERNTRKHSDANIAAIAYSLKRWGQRKPIVVNAATNIVEAGNGTLQAARSLGWTHIGAVFVDDAPEDAIGYSIADNRTAELAEWDWVVLQEAMRELDSLGALADLVGVGWTDDEVAMYIESTFEIQEPATAPPSQGQSLLVRFTGECYDIAMQVLSKKPENESAEQAIAAALKEWLK